MEATHANDASAAYFRKWSHANLDEEALAALWKVGGDVSTADMAMAHVPQKRERTEGFGAAGQSVDLALLAQDAERGALLTACIIEHRKDLVRAQRAIASKGAPISMKALQQFYYAHFRRSAEAIVLAAQIEQENEMDDGLDDHCAICGQRGLLVCCDQCSNVYHLACVKLTDVPDGEWKCPDCLKPPASHRPQRAGAWTGPVKPIAMPVEAGLGKVHVYTYRGPRPAASAAGEGAPAPAAPAATPAPAPAPAAPALHAPPTGVSAAAAAASSILAKVGAAAAASAANNGEAKRPRTGGEASSAAAAAAAAPRAAAPPTKRTFRTEDGRVYEEDILTGKVSWVTATPAVACARPVASAPPPNPNAPPTAAAVAAARAPRPK